MIADTKINWFRDVAIGVLLGAFFIFLNSLNSSLAITLPQSGGYLEEIFGSFGKYLMISGVAPIIEEILWRFLLFSILGSLGVPLLWNLVFNGISFSLFHFWAYGGVAGTTGFIGTITALSGAFIGAFIFAVVVGITIYYVNGKKFPTWAILPAIVAHSIFNSYLLIKTAGVLTFGS